MDRRDFIRRIIALSGAAATGGLAGCSRGERPDSEPTKQMGATAKTTDVPGDEPEPTPSTIAVVETSDRAGGVHRAADLLDRELRNQQVFIKPNFNSADPPPGSTHNAVLEALVRHCQSERASRITVGDRSGMDDTEEVMRQKQIFAMSDELGFDTLIFDDLAREDWQLIEDERYHWERGFAFPRPVIDADAYIQTCCLKTHRFGGHFTMALKNNVGLAARMLPGESYNYMEELHDSDNQRLMIAELNDAITHSLIVLDAVEGFYEQGPESGPVATFNAVIAGTDPVAIDALGVALLRRHGTTPEVSRGPIAGLAQIARASELGVGTADPEMMEIVTDDENSQQLADELLSLL